MTLIHTRYKPLGSEDPEVPGMIYMIKQNNILQTMDENHRKKMRTIVMKCIRIKITTNFFFRDNVHSISWSPISFLNYPLNYNNINFLV